MYIYICVYIYIYIYIYILQEVIGFSRVVGDECDMVLPDNIPTLDPLIPAMQQALQMRKDASAAEAGLKGV